MVSAHVFEKRFLPECGHLKTGPLISLITARMIQFDCPKCLQQINARDQQAGQRIDCPVCATSLMVPATSSGNFDNLFDSDEHTLDEPATNENSPTVTAPLVDESIDSAPANKVRPSPITQKTTIPASQPEPEPETELEPIDESSDDFEDLQFPETLDSTDQADSTAGTEFPVEDPFAVDPDKPLEVDGITDLTSAPGSFSLKCPVCESHLFVTTHVVGTEVKCADCFSPITVPKPTKKQLEAASKIRMKESDAAKTEPETAEATEAVDVDPSFGLAPVNRDLLAPAKEPEDEDDDELKLEDPTELFGELDELSTPAIAPSSLASSNNGKSKTKDADAEGIDPYRSRSAQVAKQKKRRNKKRPKQETSSGLDFPKFEFDSLFGEMVNLVSTPTVALRCILSALLLAAGNVVGHFAVSNHSEIQDPTMGDTGFMWFWRAGIGWTLFGLGTIFLWYTAGIIFRKTAVGRRRIDSWRIGPSTEWTSTFLLISFSFAVAGSPLMMFGATWLSAPVRFFLALPMLVSVWFTQSPFKIISVDAFSRYRRQRPQWKSVWLVILALASIAFVSGLMMAIPVPYLNIITSVIGAVVLSFATLGYAAVAGWHSGKVVEELN